MNNQPTVFHITHHKAGSQWVAEVLKYCALERIVPPKIGVAHFRNEAIKPGGIYPTVYVSKQEFEAVMASATYCNWRTHILRYLQTFLSRQNDYIKFIVIRDLRDTLVSLYISLKISHPLLTDQYYKWRKTLNRLDKEGGFIYLMDGILLDIANIQLSWLNDEALLITYENLLADEYTVFERIMNYCQIDVARQRLHEIIRYNSFEAVTGRKPGEEDVTAHQRKGISGDWRNHFSERVKEEFKKRFGDVLIKTGYEYDRNW